MIALPIAQSILLLFGGALLYFLKGEAQAFSFAIGAGISLLNLVGITVSWPFLLRKKLVALSTSVIVFKFAILGWIIYEVANSKSLRLGWVGAGLSTVVISVMIAMVIMTPDANTKTKSQA